MQPEEHNSCLSDTEIQLSVRAQALSKSLHEVLIKDGVLAEDSLPTGAELLMAAEEYCNAED